MGRVVRLYGDSQAATRKKWKTRGEGKARYRLLGNAVAKHIFSEQTIDLEMEDNNGYTALSGLIANGHEVVARLLLNKGANVEARDNSGRMPLSGAAEQGQEAVVKLLLEKGANIEAGFYLAPLLLAAEGGHKAVVKLLRTAEPRIHIGGKGG